MFARMKVAAASLLLLLSTIAFVGATTTPAHAGQFSEVYHPSDDSGYTAAIKIMCADGRIRYLYLGEGSPEKCGAHTEYVYVGSGQQLRCVNMLPPWGWRTISNFGWNYVPSFTSLKCYMQRA